MLTPNLFSEVAESTADVSSDKVKPEEQQQTEDAVPVAEKIAEQPAVEEESHPEPETALEQVPVVIHAVTEEQENAVVQAVMDEKIVETSVKVGAAVKPATARNIKTPSVAVSKTATPTVSGSGAVGRSQIPKSATKTTESSPSKATAEVTRTSPTKTTTTSAVKSRSSMAVVGRAKTVELGKSATKKMSVGELQAPRVVRQMSTGHMQPQSPSRTLPVKSIPRLNKSVESPAKKVVTSSAKTEESKKTATTTGNVSILL